MNVAHKQVDENYKETKDKKSRGFAITLWPHKMCGDTVKQILPKGWTYLIYQKEKCPTSGTEHFQCGVYYKNPRSLFALRKTLYGHNVTVKRTDALWDYCCKEDTRIDGPWEEGTRPVQGQRSDIIALESKIKSGSTFKDIADSDFELSVTFSNCINKLCALYAEKRDWKMKIFYIWGSAGKGKSRWIWNKHGINNVYKKTFKSEFWEAYNGEEAVLLDEYNKNFDREYFLDITDRYPLIVNIKGSHAQFRSRWIYITSNFPPEQSLFWDDACRRRITKIIKVTEDTTASDIQAELYESPEELAEFWGTDEPIPEKEPLFEGVKALINAKNTPLVQPNEDNVVDDI